MDCQTQIQNVLFNSTFSLPQNSTSLFNSSNWDWSEIGILHRNKPFSVFVRKQAIEAAKLIEIFVNFDNFTDFLTIAMYLRPKINQFMFIYAFSAAVLRRNDCPAASIPPLYQVYPDMVFDYRVLQKALDEIMNRKNKTRNRRQVPLGPIIVNNFFTENSQDRELRLSYFREDLGITSHHWHWHLAYPHTWQPTPQQPNIDRKGELFYYMHQQLLRRYDMERLSLGMPLTVPLKDWQSQIEEGYQPHLFSSITQMLYPGRKSGEVLKDVSHPDVGRFTLADQLLQRDLILQAIRQRYVVTPTNSRIYLDEATGMDTLGSVIEASTSSPNRFLYGDLHNNGHQMISLLNDFISQRTDPRGVMGFTETSPRDPIFYRWHKFVDMLFQEYKNILPRYSDNQLTWSDISITQMNVNTKGQKSPNRLYTFFDTDIVDISRGLDFRWDDTSVQVTVRHLQYKKFTYNFNIFNARQTPVDATVRLFLAPRFNVNNQPFNAEELRMLFAEMDKFKVELHPGPNILKRESADSSVTISPERSWIALHNTPGNTREFTFVSNICGCGWPDHMLLPRGSANGMMFILFAMVTPYSEDRVQQFTNGACDEAASLCGIVNNPYPDRKPMGFPFDRRFQNPAIFFNRSNMFTQNVVIYHLNNNTHG